MLSTSAKRFAKDRTDRRFSAIGAPESRTKYAGCAPRGSRVYVGRASCHGNHVPVEPHVYLNSVHGTGSGPIEEVYHFTKISFIDPAFSFYVSVLSLCIRIPKKT